MRKTHLYAGRNFEFLLTILIFLFSSSTLLADNVAVTHSIEPDQLRILFQFPNSAGFTATVDNEKLIAIPVGAADLDAVFPEGNSSEKTSLAGKKLILRFEHSIDIPTLQNLQDAAPQWIEAIEMGFDSILVKTPETSLFQIYIQNGKVIAQIRKPEIKRAQSDQDEERAAEQDLRHLQSVLILKKKKFEAHSELSGLLKKFPEDPQLMVDLAEVEDRLGRWQESLRLYNEALRFQPRDRDILASKSYLEEQFGPQVRFNQYYRDTTNEEIQWVSQATVRQNLYQHYTLGLNYEYRVLDDNLARPRLNGTFQTFEGNRQQWGVFLERAHGFGHTRFTLLGQQDEPGVALKHVRPLPVGELFLRGVYNEPYWDYLEGITNEGTANRFQVKWIYEGHSPLVGRFKGQSNFTGSLGINLNRYGVEDNDTVADSIEVLVELRYHLARFFPGLSIGYNLNTEYVNLKDTRIDVAGSSFNPIPIQNLQNQAWDISLSQTLLDNYRFDLSTGYNYDDRVNSNGPFVFFDLVYDTFSNFEAGLNIEFNQETQRGTDNTFTQWGAFLLWKL